jgi:hypothetical protein
MNENKLKQQVLAIFSIFMVFFYLGAGTFLIFFFKMSTLPRFVLVLIGSTFVFLGLFRAYTAYLKIVELFFTKDKDNE